MQSKLSSFIESCVNVIIGYTISLLANLTILPIFGYDVTLGDGILISILFTFVSLCRSYLIRRWYNNRECKNNE